MGRRAHTGFVGEQAAGNTEADSFLNADADSATHDSLGSKSTHEDGLQSRQDILGIHTDGDECAANVEDGHDGNQLLSDGSDALDTAQENECGNSCHNDTRSNLGNTESGVEGITDGVGLDHVAHEAQSQNDGNSEEASHKSAQLALEGSLNEIDGTAGDSTVFTYFLILLCQNSLTVDGGHAEEGRDPHPEHSTGTTGDQSGGAASDIAGTNLGRNGSCQCLEGAHAVLTGLLTLEADIAEDQTHTLTKLANLDKAGTDGEVDAAAQQQEKQNQILVPQNIVDRCHDVCQNCFHFFTSFISFWQIKNAASKMLRRENGRELVRFVLSHSVLLPERFSSFRCLAPSVPVFGDSPEPHPFLVVT